MNNSTKTIIAATLISSVFGIAGGYWLAGINNMPSAETSSADSTEEPLFYRNPMNPEITSPVPAKDSMGMDYVPVYAESNDNAREPLFYRIRVNRYVIHSH